MGRFLALALAALAALTQSAMAADQIKLGFEAGMSGVFGIIGEEMKRGLDLALESHGQKLGGVPVTVYTVDDKADPAQAVQQASKLIDEDKIDIVTGLMSSNTVVATRNLYLDAGITVVGALSGLQQFAGKECRDGQFFVSFENEDWDDAIGKAMMDDGMKSAYFMAADYQAGWEKTQGAMRVYKGKQFGPVYTPLTQLDFSAEIAQVRQANPDALFIFYPGSLGIAFMKQFAQAGLQGKIQIYSEDTTVSELSFPAIGDAGLGVRQTGSWSYELDNPANKKFVADFVKKYGRRPTAFAALQYDAVNLIDSAVAAVNGKIEDKDAFHAALFKADFHSVRGPFKFDNNRFPIVNIYQTVVSKDDKGQLYLKLGKTAAEAWHDLYHDQCPLK
ncbi:MAG TPA: ABC transporter substrate-binding protein [Stellaceae bacterium]|nr:ABC transporter substrate-binding protein [Stellaceae bacterium]